MKQQLFKPVLFLLHKTGMAREKNSVLLTDGAASAFSLNCARRVLNFCRAAKAMPQRRAHGGVQPRPARRGMRGGCRRRRTAAHGKTWNGRVCARQQRRRARRASVQRPI